MQPVLATASILESPTCKTGAVFERWQRKRVAIPHAGARCNDIMLILVFSLAKLCQLERGHVASTRVAMQSDTEWHVVDDPDTGQERLQ